MKKLVSVVMILAMILCLGQAAMGTAFAEEQNPDPHAYYLTFDGNGGKVNVTGSPTTHRATLGQSPFAAAYQCKILTASRDGYLFLGWFTAASGGTYVSSSYVGTPSKVYAHWVKLSQTGTTFPKAGGSLKINVRECSGGHEWIIDSLKTSDGSAWAVPVPLLNGAFTIVAMQNASKKTRTLTVVVKDKTTGFTKSFGFVQEYDYEGEFNRVNNVFSNGKFLNVVEKAGANAKDGYNMCYAALFVNGVTCCTDSALMDLLNRRLALDNLLNKNYFFDIRDILEGNAQKKYDASKDTVSKKDSGHATLKLGSSFPGEKINSASSYGTITYKNKWGTIKGSAKEYTVKQLGNQGSAEKNKAKIIELLKTHPEGVVVYTRHRASSGTGTKPHALVIVGYIDGKFKYVDNACTGVMSSKPVEFNSINGWKLYAAKEEEENDWEKCQDGFFKNIKTIAYIQ